MVLVDSQGFQDLVEYLVIVDFLECQAIVDIVEYLGSVDTQVLQVFQEQVDLVE